MEALELERQDAVVLVRFNRPKRLNAINEVMLEELSEVLASLADDEAVRAVVLTGAGRGFCAGIDVRDFGPSMPPDGAPPLVNLQHQERMVDLPRRVRGLPQPVIAAVNGPAVGGGFGLCLAADIRICAESASFADAAIKLGLSGAEMGMSYHLPRIVGTSLAADWMLTGRTVTSAEALRSGLVSGLVEDAVLVSHALDLAQQVAAHPALGTRLTKRALQKNTDAPSEAAALDLENRNQVIAAASAESVAIRAAWAHPDRGDQR